MSFENIDIMTKKNGFVLDSMESMDHEQVIFCHDKESGLRSIIAIHDTTLGPALGGTRMWHYSNEEEALNDVLRLSRGMSLKASISGLELGGGKAVIIGNSQTDKTEKLLRRFGSFVDSLGGKYITAKDVGITTTDMKYIRMETNHVTGVAQNLGGSGDPSPVTAFGVYMGIKAAAQYKWGTNELKNKSIVVQGIGNVGENLVKYLKTEKANIIINDLNKNKTDYISSKYETKVINDEDLYDIDMDIYAPCALGATVNPNTISRLKCDIIAGGANNQLADENRDAKLCSDKGIIYAPDFLINAGGLINVYSEIKGYDRKKSMQKTEKIFNTTLEILKKAEIDNITTHDAALKIAESRIISLT